MSNDNKGNFSDDDTNGVDRIVDPTIDFGDEFGVVKFAETDDSGPALAFGSNDTEQLPHWTEMPTGEVPRFGKTDDQPNSSPKSIVGSTVLSTPFVSSSEKLPLLSLLMSCLPTLRVVLFPYG